MTAPDGTRLADAGTHFPRSAVFVNPGVTAAVPDVINEAKERDRLTRELKKVEKEFNSPFVVFGAGGLGLMLLTLLKAMGGKGAIVVDIDAKKREAAMAAGALATVDGKAPDALEQLAKKAGGPIRAVIDLVGNAQTTQLGFDCLTKGGKLVIVGLFGGGAPWALPLIPIKAITIQGSYVGNLRETQELLDLVRTKKIAPIPVTTRPLAKANEALTDLQKGKLVGRAVLTP